MASDDELRAKLTEALAENGVTPGSDDMHSWRCEYPQLHVCHCIPDLVDDIAVVVREVLVDAWSTGFREGRRADHQSCWWPSNPWRDEP